MYWRVLRLKHVRPTSWQRAAFFEGSLAVAAILVLADLASSWLLPVLPLAVAAIVKSHDVLVGWLGADAHEAVTDAVTQADPEAATADLAEESVPTSRAEPKPKAVPEAELAPEPDPDRNVRVVPPSKPRAARARPGAAAARAQVSATQGTRQRRTEPRPKKAESSG